MSKCAIWAEEEAEAAAISICSVAAAADAAAVMKQPRCIAASLSQLVSVFAKPAPAPRYRLATNFWFALLHVTVPFACGFSEKPLWDPVTCDQITEGLLFTAF